MKRFKRRSFKSKRSTYKRGGNRKPSQIKRYGSSRGGIRM